MTDLLAAVTAEFDRVFAALRPLADEYVTIAARHPSRDRLAALRPAIGTILQRHRGLVAGAGVIVAPDLLSDSRYWLEWWWTRADGEPEALRVNLDPAAPDFFDYTTADWYATPERTGAEHVAGPYVDYACTNEYALTVAVPAVLDGTMVGVAAADVLVSSFEQRVLPALRALPRPMALANAAGRVVAANSPHLAPGLRVPVSGPGPWHLVPV